MAWTTPTNVATGDVLTASRYNNEVVANALAGGPVYATLADLNTAIPSPYEGQRAYLTAPRLAPSPRREPLPTFPPGLTFAITAPGGFALPL